MRARSLLSEFNFNINHNPLGRDSFACANVAEEFARMVDMTNGKDQYILSINQTGENWVWHAVGKD